MNRALGGDDSSPPEQSHFVRIATWNVNSVNVRLPLLIDWLEKSSPDVVLLQELKCEEERFPVTALQDLHYNCLLVGQKSVNGVAILTKEPAELRLKRLPGVEALGARYIEAGLRMRGKYYVVASVYVPNGASLDSHHYTEEKMKFFDALKSRAIQLLDECDLVCIGGDFNVAPEVLDVHDPLFFADSVLFDMAVRSKFRALCNIGLFSAYRTLNPSAQEFSWWDYRGSSLQKNHGALIDHLLLSPGAADRLAAASIDKYMRTLNSTSDHAPVICELLS